MPPVLTTTTEPLPMHRVFAHGLATPRPLDPLPDSAFTKGWDEHVRVAAKRAQPHPPDHSATASVTSVTVKTVSRSGRTNGAKATSNKRTAATRDAADSVGPEPKKRRKDEVITAPVPVPPPPMVAMKRPEVHKEKLPDERPPITTDLSALPSSSLISYLVKHDIIPPIHPSPYTAQSCLVPSLLLNPPTQTPPPPPPPSSTQRISASVVPERRRSSRFQDDEFGPADEREAHIPILTDLDAVHGVLAKLAERHWPTKSVRELDTIAGFMWTAQRARERTLLAASSAGHG